MEHVTLMIDGLEITADKGMSVLEAALQNNIYIPHLCYHPDLEPYGACRLCMVEVDGRLTISCRVPADDGLIVETDTPAVNQARRVALELLLVNHPLDCLTCAQNNNCELQRAAAYIGVDHGRLGQLRREELSALQDTSNPFFDFDPNKCVLCGICVRTCDELQNIGAIDFSFRGFDTKISTFASKPWVESKCVSCGECVVRCPVGALTSKQVQQPAREVKTVCPYCGVGCGVILGVRGDKIVQVRGDRENPVNRGSLCVKGRFGQSFVNHSDRLTHPLIKENGSFREATWDEALDTVAQKLAQIKSTHGPDSLAALTSAKCTNEENYLMQKLTRAVLGTNNLDHCARL